MTMTFRKLFEPLKIGPCTLKNRIIKSPVTTRLSLLSGEVTPQLLDHYAAFARGGAAMVTVESTEVDSRHSRVRPNLRVDSDAYLAGLHELAEAIHLNGALACLQLRHVGMQGIDPVSPSGVSSQRQGKRGYVTPRAMSVAEIEEAIMLFSTAGYRAKFAGFDMVELHGGGSYLIQQFVSPHTNRRQDEWGSTFENRIRLPLEILRQIHLRCGPDFPVGIKFSMDELLPDGTDFEQATAFIKRLEQEGIAYVTGMLGSDETFHLGEGLQAMRAPKAQTVKYAERLKKQVGIAVFATFQIHEPELMEEILEKNQVDAVVLGRPLLADPEMPKKIREGRLEDICRCIRCGNCNDTSTVTHRKINCTQNPATGRERDYALRTALSRKKVLVIGGGPSGLEAARVAALRGHDVTVLEKEGELGGQIRVASLPIGKDHFMPYLIGWRARQCQKAGVKIEPGREATPEVIKEYNPDVIVVATGAKTLMPKMPGVHGKNVVSAPDVLQRKAKVGKRVVVAGGGLVGVEVADFIAEKGLAEKVTIIEMRPQIGTVEMGMQNRVYLTQKLAEYGVAVQTDSRIREITDNGVGTVDKDGNEIKVEADTVVLALGAVSEDGLEARVVGTGPEVCVIGDCKRPRNLRESILEGYHTGLCI
ncbi:MAG: FAD-dependent oxidoreductase [Chloroflexi bacterium]|nr:FAD-dependent oxidoreductase [Chloroflexota bacterium]